jgi:protein-disulfide isomerase
MNKGTAIVGFFLCFMAGMVFMYGYDHAGSKMSIEKESAGAFDHSASPIPVTSKDPIWGKADAPVTIVIFSDFQCPFCSRAEATLSQIKTQYGPEKVRLVWKNQPLPFHNNARPAAEAVEAVFQAAGKDAFWKFHDILFQNQQQLSADKYERWAQEAGADPAKFKAALASPAVKAKVDKDMAEAKQADATGTPAFRINGVTLVGAQPFDKFKEIIDKQLAEAQAAVAAGTPKGQVYVELSKKNAGSAAAKPGADNQPKKDQPAEPPEDTTIWKVPVLPDDPVRGPKDALVTMVIFSDFQCPFCKRVEDTVKQAVDTYKDDLRLVWKDNPLPFHPRAKPASTLARVAFKKKGEKAFWDAHDALFASAPQLEDADLQKVAEKIGIPWAEVKNAVDTDKFKDKFEDCSNLASDLQARGTPHFFVNGMRLQGAQPWDKFKDVIDKRLADAKARVAKGTPKAMVYEDIMKEAKGTPPPETKEIAVPKDAPFKGGAQAKVVIQQFSDFQCPFCSKVEPTMAQIEKEYGNKVKIVWRNLPLPFHNNAQLAAEAAMEAYAQKGSAGFWKFHGALFAKQSEQGALERPGLEKIAEAQGLNLAKFKEALDSHKHKDAVEADAKAANAAQISGTPAFVVGKYFVNGAQPFPQFKRAIDRALKESK